MERRRQSKGLAQETERSERFLAVKPYPAPFQGKDIYTFKRCWVLNFNSYSPAPLDNESDVRV